MSEEEYGDSDGDQSQGISKEELEWNIDRLRRSGKLEHVALLALTGEILAVSRGMTIGTDDGFAIINVLDSQYRDLTKVKLGKQYFVCFKSSETSVVGRSEEDFLCCYICESFVIVGLSDPSSQGSSIFEISRFADNFNRRSFLEASRSQDGGRGSMIEAGPSQGTRASVGSV